MASIMLEPTEVPGANDTNIIVNPGDKWPLPFRGSRYTLRQIDEKIQMCWTRMDIIHTSDSIPEGLIKAMNDYKKNTRGTIRVTPYKEIITKRKIDNGNWVTIYLGKLKGEMSFQGFELNPTSIKTCNLWRGFHFKHGEEFAVWLRDGNEDYLYWASKGIYHRSIQRYPELCSKVRDIRPRCGRLYFTEYDHIWMNLPSNEVSYEWALKFKSLIQEDKKLIADSKNDTLLQSIVERLKSTYTYPIYLGKVTDFDSGEAPRTYFTSHAKFGLGSEDKDDGDGFDSDSWKRMRRDS